jgi:histone demethylase JARID1
MTPSEFRMVKAAMKNSLIDVTSAKPGLKEIEEMKVFYPSKREFENPINYIEKLVQEGASKYGSIKIIPPPEFKPPCAFDLFSDKKLPTRYQTLQELAQGKVRKS